MTLTKTTDFLDISKEILEKGSRMRFIATGTSMGPFIKHGDVIEIEPIELASIKAGDVIFYTRPGGHGVVHRVIRTNRSENRITFLTKGDALRGFDNTVSSEQVLGRVAKVKRNGTEIKLENFGMRMISRILALGYPLSYTMIGLLIKTKRFLQRAANPG